MSIDSHGRVLMDEREDKSTTRVKGATMRALAAPRRELYSQFPRFNKTLLSRLVSRRDFAFERIVYGTFKTRAL